MITFPVDAVGSYKFFNYQCNSHIQYYETSFWFYILKYRVIGEFCVSKRLYSRGFVFLLNLKTASAQKLSFDAK